ncbi:MAG: hypothetical protein HQM10_20525 [Candidatus Riflebacteria bacterium]|nr:hypothetical protein [Candidatus Riflebacteria bacterium]
MKNTIKNYFYYSVAMIFCFISMSEANVSVVEDFISLSRVYESASFDHSLNNVKVEKELLDKENKCSEMLLASADNIALLFQKTAYIEKSLLNRLAQRITFKITLEGRSDLMASLTLTRERLSNYRPDVRTKKKIANIGGRQVDLYDGEWNTAPDGRQYWVSNEYSDIILSAAEYRRYAATAVVVDD